MKHQMKLKKEEEILKLKFQELQIESNYGRIKEFVDSTSRKVRFNEVQRLVDSAKAAQECDLNEKRER